MSATLSARALGHVLDQEGGFANNPADPGGRTMRGVIQRTYDDWRRARGLPERDVKLITFTELAAIYEGYWIDAGARHAAEAGRHDLALVMFDWGVNAGTARGRWYLQAALGAGLAVDGKLGPKTLAALAACDERAVFARYLEYRALHYRRRAAVEPARQLAQLTALGLAPVAPKPDATQRQFLATWLARLRAAARACGAPLPPTILGAV